MSTPLQASTSKYCIRPSLSGWISGQSCIMFNSRVTILSAKTTTKESSRPATGAHVDTAVVTQRTTHDDGGGACLSVTRRPQRYLVYRPAAMILSELVVDAGVARLVAFLAVGRLASRRHRRHLPAAAADSRQRRLEQRRRRRREAQSGVGVNGGGVDGDGVDGRRRWLVVDHVRVEHEVVVLVVGRRVRQLCVAVERRPGADMPVVVWRRPGPDAAHLGGELRRRSRVRVARAGRMHRRVHLDGRLVRRRSATPVRRAVRRDRRQRTRADHRARRLQLAVVHDETVRVLAPGRQTWLGRGRRPLTGRGHHRHRLAAASRQLAAELELGRRSSVDRRRATSLMSLLELTSASTPIFTTYNRHISSSAFAELPQLQVKWHKQIPGFFSTINKNHDQLYHSVAQQCIHCCKGDQLFLWKRENWGYQNSETRTNCHKILHGWLHRRCDPRMLKFKKAIAPVGRPGKWVKYYSRVVFSFFCSRPETKVQKRFPRSLIHTLLDS